jgi:hypothetical protein
MCSWAGEDCILHELKGWQFMYFLQNEITTFMYSTYQNGLYAKINFRHLYVPLPTTFRLQCCLELHFIPISFLRIRCIFMYLRGLSLRAQLCHSMWQSNQESTEFMYHGLGNCRIPCTEWLLNVLVGALLLRHYTSTFKASNIHPLTF